MAKLGAFLALLYNRSNQWKFSNQKSHSKDHSVPMSARTDLLPKEFRPGGLSLAHSLMPVPPLHREQVCVRNLLSSIKEFL